MRQNPGHRTNAAAGGANALARLDRLMLARHKIGKHVRVRVFEEAEAVPQQRSCISPLVGTDFGSARFRFARDSPLEGDGFELPVPREMTTIFEPSCFWFL
jgi:hypothetical protein